ncbi:hypothetical protein C0992_004306 [Termitomyces sp. T32_za158]|nr:hypothetical protein C0992_004306 [Termitomyces sp. T32_za158]
MSTPADLISLLTSSSSTCASPSLVPPAVLAARAYVPKIDTFFSSLVNVGPEADRQTIVGAMRVFEKWLGHRSKAPEVTWSWEEELRAWCTAQYAKHVGEVWLAPFEANFAPAPPSLEDQLADLLGNEGESLALEAESGGLTLWTELSPDSKVDDYVRPLVKLDLDWQAAIWAEAAEQWLVELMAEQEEVLMREQAALITQLTAEGRVAGILPPAPEPVAGPSGVNAPEPMAAETVKLTAVAEGSDYEGGSSGHSDENKEEDDEEIPQTPKRSKTVGSGGPLPTVEKRATKLVTPSKCRANKIIPSYVPPAKTTFSNTQLRNLLALCRDDVVLDTGQGVEELVHGIKGKNTMSAKAQRQFKLRKGACNKCWADNDPEACWFPTAALPCYQYDAFKRACTYSGVKSRERGKVDPIIQRTFERHGWEEQWQLGLGSGTQDKSKDKGKGKATATSHKQQASASGSKWRLKWSQKASRTQPPSRSTGTTSREPITPSLGPSRQRPSVLPVASLPLPSDQDKEEEEDPSNSLPIAPDSHRAAPLVMHPNWAPLPIPQVTGQEFLWLGRELYYPASALRPCPDLEAYRKQVAGMVAVISQDMRAVNAEMAGLRMRRWVLGCSLDILERYQNDYMEALQWQDDNQVKHTPPATFFPLPPGASLDMPTDSD